MIVGICGFIGSGKNSCAEIFERQGYTKLSFAGTVKDVVSIIFGWERDLLEGVTDESRIFRETVDPFWSAKFGYETTPRLILQKFATDCVRNNFLDTLWIDSLEKKILQYENVVISDVRFPNEIEFIRDMKGVIVQVDRSSTRPEWYQFIHDKYKLQQLEVHPSEYVWFGNKSISKIISNDRNFDELEKTVLKYIKNNLTK